MAAEPTGRWHVEHLSLKRFNRLLRDLEDYHPAALAAVFLHLDSAVQAEEQRRDAQTRWDEPRLTGDPVTDRWERDLANGKIPDDWK